MKNEAGNVIGLEKLNFSETEAQPLREAFETAPL